MCRQHQLEVMRFLEKLNELRWFSRTFFSLEMWPGSLKLHGLCRGCLWVPGFPVGPLPHSTLWLWRRGCAGLCHPGSFWLGSLLQVALTPSVRSSVMGKLHPHSMRQMKAVSVPFSWHRRSPHRLRWARVPPKRRPPPKQPLRFLRRTSRRKRRPLTRSMPFRKPRKSAPCPPPTCLLSSE